MPFGQFSRQLYAIKRDLLGFIGSQEDCMQKRKKPFQEIIAPFQEIITDTNIGAHRKVTLPISTEIIVSQYISKDMVQFNYNVMRNAGKRSQFTLLVNKNNKKNITFIIVHFKNSKTPKRLSTKMAVQGAYIYVQND